MEGLTLHLLAATRDAALSCLPWVGKNEPKNADAAAVAAMRATLADAPGRGTVVIGEGVKDDAPMLFDGERVGRGGPRFDLAVDPLEGTKACAAGADGSICVGAVAPGDTLLATPGWYMDKLIVGPGAVGAIDIEAPLEDNLSNIAAALGKGVPELVAVILDKPRHREVIKQLHAAGVTVDAIPDGDVLGALRAVVPDGDADLLLGIGGAPEAVLTACAVRVMNGDMQARLAPQREEEHGLLADAGQRPGVPLGLDDLVRSDECGFAATAVTPCQMLQAPSKASGVWRTQSFVATTLHPGLVVETCTGPTHVTEEELCLTR